ncbi:MAG: 2-keto-4-pentenoate hydratase [Candidatus Thorarchaeota archaeon]
MLNNEERRTAADALATAERNRVPIDPLTETWPSIDVTDAYEIQLLNIRRRVEAGARVRGHKVGLSSRAMQQMLGVDESDYGHLMDDMFIFESETVSIDRFCSPRVEIEVAFVLDKPLSGPGCTIADVLQATEFVLPAIEIIDSRILDWKIKLPDTIADNASAAAVVLGGNPTRLNDVDVRLIGAILRRNGEVIETGAAGAVLSNPAKAVAWLANKVNSFGINLDAGHVILPGSCTRAVDVRPGDSVRADFDTLGHVSVNFS